jgi:SAM-dependent MidA family methyltransferase
VSDPERFDHFMARANAAYYAAHNPFADFTTAPEISQVFGEVLGAWAKTVWTMMGAPANIMLVEAGPGRGTLMADFVSVWPAPDIHFIETSARLRAEQAAKLPAATWHDSLHDVPHRPMILIANEFLDALPVRQFIRREAGWLERHVQNAAYVELPTDIDLPDDPLGSVREINEPAAAFVTGLAHRNAIALFIDYGPGAAAPGASVQAIKNGAPADPLAEPGHADITAHVDFAALAAAARAAGAHALGPVKQNAFLASLGFHQRTDFLARKFPHLAARLQTAAHRLTAPEAMGSLFKVLAFCPLGFPTLPGFDT